MAILVAQIVFLFKSFAVCIASAEPVEGPSESNTHSEAFKQEHNLRYEKPIAFEYYKIYRYIG